MLRTHVTESKAKTRNRWSPTMRQERIIQATIFDVFAVHEIGRELKAVSEWLGEHRSPLSLVIGALRPHPIQETGRHGLSPRAVLSGAPRNPNCELTIQEVDV